MFIGIDYGKYITAINKKSIRFLIDTENDFENNKILQNLINILDDFLDLIFSK